MIWDRLYELMTRWLGNGLLVMACVLGVLLLITLSGCSTPSVRPSGMGEPLGTAAGVSVTWPTAAGPVDNYVVNPSEILSVYDGDTFYITVPECAGVLPALCGKLGVRIVGIDTPEKRGKCDAESKAATAARAFTDTALRSASTIVLEEVRREKYGRLLAAVVVDGYDLGAELVLRGMARPYDGGTRRGWCE